MSSTALGVDDALWNSLPVEVRKQVDQVEVLEQERAILANSLSLIGMGVWDTVAGAIESVLRLGIAVVNVVSIEITVLAAIGCVGSHDV